MRLVFLYGPPASGKFTIGRLVAEQAGIPLFHNHLIVDAVEAVFPFGSEEFIRLREKFWLETISSAAKIGKSLIFTFAPEPTVTRKFPERLSKAVADHGGKMIPVALFLDNEEQERRIANTDRTKYGKMTSIAQLRALRPTMNACMNAMPTPELRIDTGRVTADAAAKIICRALDN